MKKLTHIDFGISTMLWSAYFLNVFSPIFLLLPFLAVLSDADHWKDGLSRKGLSLPWKHRWWSHSIGGTILLSVIVSLVIIWLLYFVKNIPQNILQSILNSYFYILLLYVVITIIWLVLSRISKFIAWFIVIFWFLWWLFYLFHLWYINSFIFLILLFIFSHLLWDYFTVSWIPLLFPFSKERFRFLFYVSTNTQGEEFVKFIITLVNIWLLYFLYKSNYISTIMQYKPWLLDLVFVIFWFLVIIYFFNQEFNFKKNILAKSGKVVKTTFGNVLKTLLSVTTSLWLLYIAYLIYIHWIQLPSFITSDLYTVIAGIIASLWAFWVWIWIIQITRTFTWLFDISDIFVYIVLFLLQFGLSGIVVYLYFIK